MRFRLPVWRVVLPVATAGALLACGDGGVGARVDRAPRRVVSLVPSSTDIVVALGEGARLVARTDFDYAPRLAGLPSVGGTANPSIEAIVALRPDVVIVWSDGAVSRAAEKLRSLGVRTEAVSAATLGDFADAVTRLGRLLQVPNRADSLLRAVTDSLESVRASTASRPRRRVFYMVWHHPIVTTGPGTFIDSLLEVAGGTNIFADARSDWPTVDLEEIVARDPDVIIWAIEGGRDMRTSLGEDSPWTKLRAVRQGRLKVVNADLLNRPDSRIGQSARLLAQAIHGAPNE